jgi:hypothetical protein
VADLFRVFPFVPGSPAKAPGGALHVPLQRGGRLDNPDVYSVFYASDAAAGALAEAFGRFPDWTPAILEGSPALPGSRRAIAQYRVETGTPICNLDDPAQLLELGLRPSNVVSRDYTRTREWAKEVHRRGRWAGIRWWSYYDSRWSSFGFWNTAPLSLVEVRPLTLDDAALLEAARTICRRVLARH